jgi:addiction module HigA family antidote
MIANANVKIDWAPNHAGMSVVLDAGALVPQGPDLFRSAGLAILGSHHDRLALALRLELEAIDRGIKAVYASAHEQAHIFAHELFSQKRFWRLYRDIGGLTGRRTFGRNDVPAGPTGPLPELELSSRQISQILRRMLAGLSQSDQDGLSLVTFLRTILFKQVAALAAFKAACMRREPVAAGTLRDRVLSLEIHTGSSPPATAAMSLAACKATLPIAALQVNYETICQQDHRTHRNDPLQRRHPPARWQRTRSCSFSSLVTLIRTSASSARSTVSPRPTGFTACRSRASGSSPSNGRRILAPIRFVSNGGRPAMTTAKFVPAPPVTPGDVLRKRILGADITQDTLAKAMDVSRFSVSQIINGKRAITPEMALRLSHVTSTTPEYWLDLQRAVDLYAARRKLAAELKRLRVVRAPKIESELYKDA